VNVIPRVIGFAGELREKKGMRTLLTAYAQVNKKIPATLLIVGDIRAGEDKQRFEEFRLSNFDARIVVTGYVSPKDMPAYYALMDVLVQPSLRDGLPNALLEAMSCGKAVIGTGVGGIVEAVENCKNGRLVSAKDADQLVSVINELLSDNQLRMKLGIAARQTIIEKFTLEKELSKNLFLYRHLGLKT
jgi:glycosyltransferase involved in cell wall biosynthesis